MVANIYLDHEISYRRLKKKTNLYFKSNESKISRSTVFAPYDGKFTLSIYKGKIRISYWDEDTEEGRTAIKLLKAYIQNTFTNMSLGVTCSEKCNLFDELNNISIIKM